MLAELCALFVFALAKVLKVRFVALRRLRRRPPGARLHLLSCFARQNAIREKQQALNFLRLSSRIDGVAARVDTAIKMGNVSKLMGGVVDGMDVALKSMDTEKVYYLHPF